MNARTPTAASEDRFEQDDGDDEANEENDADRAAKELEHYILRRILPEKIAAAGRARL
jgi:hypothetical protein